MKKNNYYLHINSGSLAHYLKSGCIKPSILFINRERDFQDNCSDKIILSTKKWNKDSDCSIEVILNSEEVKSLEKLGRDYHLYSSILPISRIKTVLFSKEEIADDVTWKINSTSAFLPKRIVRTEEPLIIDTAQGNLSSQNIKANNIETLNIKLKRFDRLMGGIAFMRTSINCIEDETINFPQNYFDTISYFNNYIRNEVKNSNIKVNDYFHNIFTLKAPIVSFLNKKIDSSIVEKIADEENLSLKSNFGVLTLDNIPHTSLTFKLAILNTFGKEETKSVESLIGDLFPSLSPKVGGEIAVLFGLYNGYGSIRNYYKFSNKKVIAKFELNSNIDYYIIETLFQYSFKSKQLNDSFDWLKPIMPDGIKTNVSFDYKSYEVFGNTVVLSKNDYSDLLNKILVNVTSEICNWFPKNIVSINKEVVSEKLNSIIKPDIDRLIKEVQEDVSNSLIQNVNESTSIKHKAEENIEKDFIEESKARHPVAKKEVNVLTKSETIYKPKDKLRESVIKLKNTNDADLFSGSEETSEIKQTESLKNKFTYSQMNKKFKAPELKEYAQTLGLTIPKGLNKPDAIKFILSNQD